MANKVSAKESTAKPVLSGHSKIDKTKLLKTNGSLMWSKVLQNALSLPAKKGLEKQCKPRSDNFWRSSLISFCFAILTSILWVLALKTNILFENRKRKVLKKLKIFTVHPKTLPRIMDHVQVEIVNFTMNYFYFCMVLSGT